MLEILLASPTENNNKTSVSEWEEPVNTSLPLSPIDPNHLIHEHWHMATHIANNYRNIPGLDFDDILQHSRMALVKAARNYNSTHKIRFSTFAWCTIRNELNSLYLRQKKYATRELYITKTSPDGGKDIPLAYTAHAPEPDASTQIENRELQLALNQSIAKLPQVLQKIVREIMLNRGYKEIGKDLGYSDASAKTLVSRSYKRALYILKEEMKLMGYETSCLN